MLSGLLLSSSQTLHCRVPHTDSYAAFAYTMAVSDGRPPATFRRFRALHWLVIVQAIFLTAYIVFIDPASLKDKIVSFMNADADNSNQSSISYADNVTVFLSTTPLSTSTTPEPACGYLARTLWDGRLGSQMFVYASFYGQIKRYNLHANKKAFIRVLNLPSSLDTVFGSLSIPQRIYPDSWFQNRSFVLYPEKNGCCTFDSSGLENITCDGVNISVGGYRDNYQYFADYTQDIKREFTFIPRIQQQCEKIYNETLTQKGLKNKNCTTIGVHLRRGDFTGWRQVKHGHLAAQLDYLQRAIRYFEELTYNNRSKVITSLWSIIDKNKKCLIFLIFGDNYEWNVNATQEIDLLNPSQSHLILMHWAKSEPAIDMCMMGLCDHAIISTGTFSWWVGFFSKGIVIHQKDFAKVNSTHWLEYNPDEYFPKRWIPL